MRSPAASSGGADSDRKRGGGKNVVLDFLEQDGSSRRFYNPEVCQRSISSSFADGDLDEINGALYALEAVLRTTSLSICEIRIIVCLVIYGGLTHMDLQELTGMKQSAVSRAITRLSKKKLVYSRIGKKYEVGRPYQLVALNFEIDDFLDRVESIATSGLDGLGYLKSLRTEQDGDGD